MDKADKNKKWQWKYSVWAVLGVAVALTTITLLADEPIQHLSENGVLYGLFMFNALVMPISLQKQSTDYPFKQEAQPLTVLRVENEQLWVAEQSIPLVNINKVVIDQCSAKRAYLHFPYTGGGKVGLSFPLQQLSQVKHFIQTHVPHATFIR